MTAASGAQGPWVSLAILGASGASVPSSNLGGPTTTSSSVNFGELSRAHPSSAPWISRALYRTSILVVGLVLAPEFESGSVD